MTPPAMKVQGFPVQQVVNELLRKLKNGIVIANATVFDRKVYKFEWPLGHSIGVALGGGVRGT